MAQEGSFLYKMKLDLDAGQAAAEFTSSLQNINSQVENVSTSLTGLRARIQNALSTSSGQGGFGGVRFRRARQQIEQMDTSLRDVVQTGAQLEDVATGTSFGVLEESVQGLKQRFDSVLTSARQVDANISEMGVSLTQNADRAEDLANKFPGVANAVDDVNAELIQTGNALEEAGSGTGFQQMVQSANLAADAQEDLQQEVIQTANAQEEANQASRRYSNQNMKTTQTSQNLLRIMQDSQFGMMGMANNFQALGESLGRAQTRGETAFSQLKAGIASLLTGPMALPAAITAVTLLFQNLEKLPAPVQDLIGELQDVLKELNLMNTALENVVEGLRDVENGAKVLKNLSEEARDSLESGVQSRIDSLETQIEKQKESLGVEESRAEIMQRLMDEENMNRIEAAIEATSMIWERSQQQGDVASELNRLQDQLNKQQRILEVINQENVKREQKVESLVELGIEEEAARNAIRKDEEETTKEKDKQIDKQKRLNELAIEAMPDDALGTQIAQIQQKTRERLAEARDDLSGQALEDAEAYIQSSAFQNRMSAVTESAREFFDQSQDGMVMDMGGSIGELFLPFGPGEGSDQQKADFIGKAKEQLEQVRTEVQDELESIRFRQQRGQVGQSLFDGDVLSQDLEFQKKLIEQETQARKERLEAQKTYNAAQLAAQNIGWNEYMKNKKRIENEITRIQKQAQRDRERMTIEHYKRIANSIESSPVGNATSNLIDTISSVWIGFHEDKFNWEKKGMDQQAALIGQLGGEIVGAASEVASARFESWKSERAQDLKDQGKNAEQRRKILKEEGKKRFQTVKALRITEASINTAAGITRAFADLPIWAAIPAAASVAASGLMRINQIAGMSIGDKLNGGAGGGAGEAGGKFTQVGAASSATAASRAGTRMSRERTNDEDTIKKTAEQVGREVAGRMPDKVVMEDSTAEQSQEVAMNRQNKLNK